MGGAIQNETIYITIISTITLTLRVNSAPQLESHLCVVVAIAILIVIDITIVLIIVMIMTVIVNGRVLLIVLVIFTGV